MRHEDWDEAPIGSKVNEVEANSNEAEWKELPLSVHDCEDLKKSCLLPSTVRKLGWRTDTNENNRKLLNWPEEWKGDAGGLVLLYPGSAYAKVKPHRERVLRMKEAQSAFPTATFTNRILPSVTSDEVKGEPAKVREYEAPFGFAPQIFNTKIICPELQDEEVPMALIEGEKKAALLAQEGIPALGLPGISMAHDVEARRRSWDELSDEWVPHSEVSSCLAQGRTVFVCGDAPDMDGTNVNVVREVVRIAKGLSARGCDPQVPYVEHDPHHEKSGVDDWVHREMTKLVAANRHKTEAWARRSLIGQYLASARPALPSALCDWLVARHEEHGGLKEIEIKRALVWCSVWFSTEQEIFKKWIGTLKRKKVCKPEVIDRLVQALPRVESRFEPRKWVQHWMGKNDVTYAYASDGFQIGGRMLPASEFLSQIEIESTNERTGISVRNLHNAVRLWEADQRRAIVEQYREKLEFRENGRRGDAEEFLRATTGRLDPVDLVVVLHFIWQVKRKLFGRPVTDHLMPILVGKQRGGKTTAIKRFLQPLGDLVGFPADLQFLTDERQQFRLTRCYAMFFDEMAKAERVASDVLKNRITAERIEYRVLGVQKLQTGTNNATFIGASNKQVKEIVVDPTGMRRFYQVDCLPQMNWAALAQIDFLAMWTSVDEEAESPLLDQLTQAQVRQDEIRAKDSVEDFFERRCTESKDWIKSTALYDQYFEDLKRQGRERAALTTTKFGERMKELIGGEGKGWKRSDGIKYLIAVKPWSSEANEPFERRGVQ
ncbi:DUF3854 domain-containing protein [Myxococcus sp. 1LA]